MANTYTLISSSVLSTTATSVTFSSIPATYTDLIMKWSSRSNSASNGTFGTFRFNGSSSTNYSTRILYSNGSTVSNDAVSSRDDLFSEFLTNGGASTSSTFSSGELYFPSYTSSTYKPVLVDSRTETNASTQAYIGMVAGLWSNTSAITSLTIYSGSTASPSDSFVSGSSFYLYGIKNS
jgi:hypothetical protein